MPPGMWCRQTFCSGNGDCIDKIDIDTSTTVSKLGRCKCDVGWIGSYCDSFDEKSHVLEHWAMNKPASDLNIPSSVTPQTPMVSGLQFVNPNGIVIPKSIENCILGTCHAVTQCDSRFISRGVPDATKLN